MKVNEGKKNLFLSDMRENGRWFCAPAFGLSAGWLPKTRIIQYSAWPIVPFHQLALRRPGGSPLLLPSCRAWFSFASRPKSNWTTIPMRCFYHQDREAVGGCKSCGKGLCPECAVDLGKGLACRGRCEADAQALIQLLEQNVRHMDVVERALQGRRSVLQQNTSTRYATGLFCAVAGAIFSIFGAADLERFAFVFVLGIAFLIFAVYWIILARRYEKDKPPEKKPES
jgi:hypothetical protein